MKITKKHILSFLILTSVFAAQVYLVFGLTPQKVAQAGTTLWDSQVGLGKTGEGQGVIGKVGFSKDSTNVSDVRTIVARVIRIFLGFLGTVFVVLMLTAGFKWMNSQGDEKAISSAKQQIAAAVIGLMIVLASYSITYLVMRYAVNATYQ